MTLTKFMARSTWVAHAFEWEKLLKCHLKGKASKKLANGQNIDYSEKRKRPKGFICPCTGVKYHNIQTCLLVYAADSGERLQDHWSSGYRLRYMCRDVRKQVFWVSDLVQHKPVCAGRKRLEAWNFRFKKKSDCTIGVLKTKALISCAVTVQLIFLCKYLVFS